MYLLLVSNTLKGTARSLFLWLACYTPPMSHQQQLCNLLAAYGANSEIEQATLDKMLAFAKKYPDCFDRLNAHGHFTGSAWLISPDAQSALLTHHKKLNMWLQPGGHAEDETDIRAVALREAQEESGIDHIHCLEAGIFDIDAHQFPANGDMPEHTHFDIRFLIQAEEYEHNKSEESNELKWFTYPQFKAMSGELDPSVWRMAQKWHARQHVDLSIAS